VKQEHVGLHHHKRLTAQSHAFRLLIHTPVLRLSKVFLWCLLFAFFKLMFSFSIHFLFYGRLFHESSSSFFFCLARCMPPRGIYSDVTFPYIAIYLVAGFFPNFRWDALWGIYSDVSLPYPTLPSPFPLVFSTGWGEQHLFLAGLRAFSKLPLRCPLRHSNVTLPNHTWELQAQNRYPG